MRIVIHGLNYLPEPTGISRYTAGLANGLAGRGHDVRVITGYPHYPSWELEPGYGGVTSSELLDGVPVRRLRHVVRGGSAGARVALEGSFAAHALTRGVPAADVVITVSPSLLGAAAALAAARSPLLRARPATGVVVQDIYSKAVAETGTLGARATGLVRKLERGVLLAADGVAVIHDRFARTLETELSVAPDRITVIRNWSEPPSEQADAAWTRDRLGWGDDELVVLHAGNMGLKQGLENVVDAAGLANGDRKIRFVLLGDGNQRSALELRAKGVASLDLVRPLPDGAFAAALAHADVLLVNELPGVSEMSVPSKLTTYFWAGRPVLAAVDPRGATAHEIAASGGGIVVAPGQPDALLNAARELASDPTRRTALGESGRRYATDVLSREAAVDAYEEWARSLVSTRAARR